MFSCQIDARSDRTGEVIFKDNFNHAVAGVVQVGAIWMDSSCPLDLYTNNIFILTHLLTCLSCSVVFKQIRERNLVKSKC